MAINNTKLGFVLGSPLGDFDTLPSATGFALEDAVGGFSLGTTALGGLINPLGYPGTLPVPLGGLSFFPKDLVLIIHGLLVIGVGSLAFTTLAPTLNIARTVPATSISFTGLAPQVSEARQTPAGSLIFTGLTPSTDFIVPSGDLTFTGLQPRILQLQSVPSGSLTFTGRAPSFATGKIIPAGSLTFTGRAPAQRLVVPSTSLTFSTFAPLQNRIVPKGTLTFIGLAPATSQHVVTPVGSLIFTGHPPVLPNALVPDTGLLSFTGLVPTLLNPKTVVVPAGSLLFTGNSVTLAPIVPTGHLVFTAYIPAVNIPIIVDPGSLLFSTLPYVLFNGAALSPNATTLIFTPGHPTTYITGPFPTGSLIFTGYAPRITGNVPKGTLIFTGQNIVLLSGLAHIVPLGHLIFTGYAPSLNNSTFPIVGAGSAGRVWVISFEDRTWKIEPQIVYVTSENRIDDAH